MNSFASAIDLSSLIIEMYIVGGLLIGVAIVMFSFEKVQELLGEFREDRADFRDGTDDWDSDYKFSDWYRYRNKN